jgi:hypothetical protein
VPSPDGNTQRRPEEWKSGDEPMTEAQAAYLRRLSEDAGEPFDPSLSKADASRRIDELRSRPAGTKPQRKGSAARAESTRTRDRATPRGETAGDEPMTPAQAAYLRELAEEERGDFDPSYTKREAARRIGELLIQQMSRTSPTEPSRR